MQFLYLSEVAWFEPWVEEEGGISEVAKKYRVGWGAIFEKPILSYLLRALASEPFW